MEFEFRADREAHLKMLCAEMGRSVDDFINEAVLTFMEDYEDGRDAKIALEEQKRTGEPMISLEEMMREFGLAAQDLTDGEEATAAVGQAGAEENSCVPTHPASRAA